MSTEAIVGAVVQLFVLLGILGIILYWLRYRARLRELMVRERIALIERGVLPPPERDPGSFESELGGRPVQALSSPQGLRYRTLGVTLAGIGLALTLIISVAAGERQVGLGIGGAVAALGAAAYLNGLLVGRESMKANDDVEAPPAER